MSAWTKVALRELQDNAVAGGFGEYQEARFARGELGAEQTGISLQRLKPGKRSPFGHRHGEDEEIYVVVAGSGNALLGDELVAVRPWDALRVAPGTARAFEAGDDGLELIAFGSHTDDDAELIKEPWEGH